MLMGKYISRAALIISIMGITACVVMPEAALTKQSLPANTVVVAKPSVLPKNAVLARVFKYRFNQHQLTFKTTSNGCTYAKDFGLKVVADKLALFRFKGDFCRATTHLKEITIKVPCKLVAKRELINRLENPNVLRIRRK